MLEALKQIVRGTPLYYPLRNCWHWMDQGRDLERWEASGRPAPPPHVVKQRVIKEYAEKYNLEILIETGTFRGDMVEAMKNVFDQIYSVELSHALFQAARRRFRSQRHIRIIQGDSAVVLELLIKEIGCPALFWLDGHYSAGVTAKGRNDTPIYDELTHILASPIKGHVIIIDDARCFGTDPAYPTIEEVKRFVLSKCPSLKVAVDTDSIRITPEP